MVPARNDKLIFEDIGYMFFGNMLTAPAWMILFQTNSSIGFSFALIVIFGMLLSCFILMRQSTRTKVNAVEFICLRCGFSMYTGWVTAATFLNVTFALKSYGLFGDSLNKGFVDEETWTIINLWFALITFNLIQGAERNPIYGGVFIWTLFAIWDNV